MKRQLTERVINGLKPPRSGRLEVGDTKAAGLVLRVTQRGIKSFSVIYRSPATRRQVRYTLGPWPEVSLKAARDRALELRTEVRRRGRDPRAEEREAEAETFAAVAERFVELVAKPNIASWRNVDSALRRYMLPAWGARPISSIRRRDVYALLDGILEEGKRGAAREVRKHVSRIFAWAYDRELVDTNPAYRLRSKDLRQPEVGRALDDDELRAVWLGAEKMGYPWQQVFQLILLTGARRQEIAHARWSEVDRSRRLIELGRERQKSAREHLIPLSDLAWSLVESCPVFGGHEDPALFTCTGGRVGVIGFTKARKRLDEATSEILGRPIGHYRTHDLRVTCRTRLAMLGVPGEVAEAVLGHAKQGIVGVYNKYQYLDEKRAALQRYADHVRELAGAGACPRRRKAG